MTNMIVDELGRIPMSPFLTATLTRAAEYASAQAHREVTLEHLLLALAEDPEASIVLKSSNVDLARLTAEVSEYLGQSLERGDLSAPEIATISSDLRRVLEAAAAAAQQGRRREINGAIVLAAIVGDGKSTAAHYLRNQGLTFEEAIRALQRATAAPAPQPADVEPASSTEDEPAAVRERVETRTRELEPPVSTSSDEEYDDGAGSHSEPAYSNGSYAPPPAPYAEPLPATEEPPPAPEPRRTARDDANSWAPPREEMPSRSAGSTRAPAPYVGPAPTQFGTPPPPPVPAAPRTTEQPMARPANPAPPWPEQPGELRRAPPRPPQSPTAKRAATPGSGTFMGNWPHIEQGQLVENIPRHMRVGIPVTVEARIARADIKALADNLQGGGAAFRHDVVVTKAMSMRLRAPDGGFVVETRSPETQWIENVLGITSDDYASWRWTITAKERGKRQLQLIVSARTVGADGLTAETALPDQVIDVKVGINYSESARHWMGWAIAAVVGGLFARFGEGIFDILGRLFR